MTIGDVTGVSASGVVSARVLPLGWAVERSLGTLAEQRANTMEHAVSRRRGFSAPHLSSLWRRRRAEVVSIRAEVEEPNLGFEVHPGDERYYELGCLPPGHQREDQRDVG
jgi:hypothetical protein